MSPQTYVEAPTISGKAPKIGNIEFITSREANMRLKRDSTGLPDTALVCWVELYGPFDMSKVAHAPGTKPLPTMSVAIEIFDAQTGNLLMSSAHP